MSSSTSDIALRVNQLPVTIEIPKDQKEFYDFLYLHFKRISNSVNTRTGGLYSLNEQYNSNQYYTPNNPNIFRNVYRKTLDLVQLNAGNIGAGATVVFPHGITGLVNSALIYASCTSIDVPPKFFTVVYPNVFLDIVNVHFTNPLATVLSQCVVIAEYLKN